MKVCVRLFAVAKELAGASSIDVDLPEGATIGDLRRRLVDKIPALQTMMGGMMFAIDSEYARDGECVSAKAEIACIPPVSGG